MIPHQIRLDLPAWLRDFWLEAASRRHTGDSARMELVLALARRNIAAGGGPFGAAIFDRTDGALISLGANRVIASNCSLWHAETVAIALAHRLTGRQPLDPALELITSCEPCCMCLGAVTWSGVKRVVCGARDADARVVGFDEGPKPADWLGACRERGIQVRRDVCRPRARELLQHYAAAGGVIYNG